jgi:chromosomal replication initiation ATPase DnaA
MSSGSSGGAKVVGLAGRKPSRPADPRAARLVDLVCRELGVAPEHPLGRSRRAEIARARQLAMYLCYVALGKRLATIGLLFGRDRSTASHACGHIEDLRDDAIFDSMVERLEAALAEPQAGSETREVLRAAG